jgi:uncharacterized protein
MMNRYFDLAFTPSVKAEQQCHGSREAYARASGKGIGEGARDTLSEREISFIAARDSFYLASVSEAGWPYVQHRGGPVGFVKRLNGRGIGWADYSGNRQYVSIGNVATNDRVAMIFMDYPRRRRLKLLGHMRLFEALDRPDLFAILAGEHRESHVEHFITVEVEGFDWNCPQYITPRFTLTEIERLVAPLHTKIAELEARLSATSSNSSNESAASTNPNQPPLEEQPQSQNGPMLYPSE